MTSASNDNSDRAIALALAISAFRAGFVAGADPNAAGLGPCPVDAHLRQYWIDGYECGMAAARAAEGSYRRMLEGTAPVVF